MILIFGGAYQGKLGYAKDNYDIGKIFDCRNRETADRGSFAGSDTDLAEELDWELTGPADVICGLECFVKECVTKDMDAVEWFRERRTGWQDKILIIQDQSQGVVPIDRIERAAREMNGRLMIYLAGEADRVIRVFCGIGKEIK